MVDPGDMFSGYMLGGPYPVMMTDYVGIAGIDVGSAMETCAQLGGTPLASPLESAGDLQ